MISKQLIKQVLFGAFFCFVITGSLFAQVSGYVHKSERDDYFRDAVQDPYGNYFLLTYSGDYFGGNDRCEIIKLNADFEKVDHLELGTFNGEYSLEQILVSPDSALIIGGVIRDSINKARINFWKYDLDLNLIWSKGFGSNSTTQYLGKMRYNAQGEYYYFPGHERNGNYYGVSVGKIDLNGDSIIEKYYDKNGQRIFIWDVIIKENEAYLLSHNFPGLTHGGSQIVRLDSNLEVDTVMDLEGPSTNYDSVIYYTNTCSFEVINDSSFMIAGRVTNHVVMSWMVDHFDFGVQIRSMDLQVDTTYIHHTFDIREHPGNENIGIASDFIYAAATTNFSQNATLISPDTNALLLFRLNKDGSIAKHFRISLNSYIIMYGVIALSNGSALIYGSNYKEGINGSNERDAIAILVDSLGNYDKTVGIEKLTQSENQLYIFPNPTNGQFELIGLPKDATVELFDMQGRSVNDVSKRTITDNSISIDLKNQDNGMYLVRVQTADGSVYIEKLIKQ